MTQQEEIEQLRKIVNGYGEVIAWALGERGEFPDWPPSLQMIGGPKYWWRNEMRDRAKAVILQAALAHAEAGEQP